MVLGEFVALLVTVTLPVTLPVADGVNVTFKVAVWPDVRICPEETPAAVNPAPAMLTPETVTDEFPAFVNVTGRMLLLPRLTLEKLKLVWLAFRMSVAAFTVNVAALLVTLPAALVTVTVNSAPLSAVVSAGVVYDAEVAPPIAVPFFFH